MKKTIILLCILGMIPLCSVMGQTSKGSFLLGGASQFSLAPSGGELGVANLLGNGFSTIKAKSDSEITNDDETKAWSFNLSPKLGYFVLNNLVLGTEIGLSTSRLKDKSPGYEYEYTNSLVGLGPFARYYFPSGKVYPFLETGVTFGQLRSKWDDFEEKTGLSGFHFGAGMGMFTGGKLGFDFSVGYQSLSYKEKENNPDNYRMVVSTLGIRVGFMVLLGPN